MKMNQETKNPGEIETERALFRPIPVFLASRFILFLYEVAGST